MSKSHPEAVIAAIYAGDYKVIERYVTKDNVNLVDGHGETLLCMAATGGDECMRIVRLLLKRGADVNIRLREGGTLLHFAAHLLRKNLAAELLRAGCDPNAKNDAGETALSKVLWAFNPKADLIEILLEHGADPTMKAVGGETALELAARTNQSDLFHKN